MPVIPVLSRDGSFSSNLSVIHYLFPLQLWPYSSIFFLIPLLRYSLAFVWIATAIITGFIAPRAQTMKLFAEAGIARTASELFFTTSLVADFLLGLTLLFNYKLKLFGGIQIALMLFYTIFISIMSPQWLWHPYGPIIKNIPMIVATVLLIAVRRKK